MSRRLHSKTEKLFQSSSGTTGVLSKILNEIQNADMQELQNVVFNGKMREPS